MKQADQREAWNQGYLFLEPPDTNLLRLLSIAEEIYKHYPIIRRLIEADLDAHGKRVKARALADKVYAAEHNQVALPLGEAALDAADCLDADKLTLEVGRPRTAAIVVYFALVYRAYMGGLSSELSWDYFIDSQTVQHFLLQHGAKRPARSTLLTLVNAIEESTDQKIIDCQADFVLTEALDDLREQTIDSTAIAGNSAWPCDVQLITNFIERAWGLSQKLPQWNLPAFPVVWPETWLPELQSAKVSLLLYNGNKKKQKRRLFNAFVSLADRLLNWLHREHDKREERILSCDLPPSQRDKLRLLWRQLGSDLSDADVLLNYYSEKTLNSFKKGAKESDKDKEKRQDWEKIYSLSDGSSSFIIKGDRHPTFGYKAQFSRSAQGFITAVKVPDGNDADSNQLIPMVKEHIRCTGVRPSLVSADDGYASGPHRDYLVNTLGVEHVSISGAKGRRQTAEELWESDFYIQARADRSAVESTIGHMKQCFSLRRCHRRGIENVRCEILETVIAFNFWRIGYVRAQKLAEARAAERKRPAA